MGRMSKFFNKFLSVVCFFAAFLVIFSALSVNVKAQGPEEAGQIEGVLKHNDRNSITIYGDGAVVDGFDLTGYDVYISANNVTLKNCTGIINININAGLSGITVENNTIVGPTEYGISMFADNSVIKGNIITGASAAAISCQNNSWNKICDNKVENHPGLHSMYFYHCPNLEVSGNYINNSAHYGMVFDGCSGAVIKDNQILNSVSSTNCDIYNHGDALVLTNGASDSQVIGNTVDGVASRIPDYGNGIIVAYDSNNVLVKDNIVSNVGNHGIQVSFWAQNATLDGNTVTKSGYQGISVSRDASSDVINNKVYDNIENGIVYDGHAHNPNRNYVHGSIKNNDCYSNTGTGIYVLDANADIVGNRVSTNGVSGIRTDGNSSGTMDSNTLKDNNDRMGIVLYGTSNYTINNNTIYKTNRDARGLGLVLDQNAVARVTNNKINNYGENGIYASSKTTITMSGNIVSVKGTEPFAGNAYFIFENGTGSLMNNQLIVNSFTPSECRGQTYVAGYKAGAIVNGKLYSTVSDSKGYIDVSFEAQPNTDNISFFVTDNNENTICVNANENFVPEETIVVDRESVMNFVARFYDLILQREFDANGLEYWTNILANREAGASQVAWGFVHSNEFVNADITDSDYIKRLYKAFFNRSAEDDPDGYYYWLKLMKVEGRSRDFVLAGFINSPEFQALCKDYGIAWSEMIVSDNPTPGKGIQVDASNVNPDKLGEFVERLYTKVLGRDSEEDGKNYYIDAIVRDKENAASVANCFFNSPEYFEKFGEDDIIYVEKMYQLFFGREAGADEVQWYLDRIETDGWTHEQIIDGFSNSPEFIEVLESYGFVVLNKPE